MLHDAEGEARHIVKYILTACGDSNHVIAVVEEMRGQHESNFLTSVINDTALYVFFTPDKIPSRCLDRQIVVRMRVASHVQVEGNGGYVGGDYQLCGFMVSTRQFAAKRERDHVAMVLQLGELLNRTVMFLQICLPAFHLPPLNRTVTVLQICLQAFHLLPQSFSIVRGSRLLCPKPRHLIAHPAIDHEQGNDSGRHQEKDSRSRNLHSPCSGFAGEPQALPPKMTVHMGAHILYGGRMRQEGPGDFYCLATLWMGEKRAFKSLSFRRGQFAEDIAIDDLIFKTDEFLEDITVFQISVFKFSPLFLRHFPEQVSGHQAVLFGFVDHDNGELSHRSYSVSARVGGKAFPNTFFQFISEAIGSNPEGEHGERIFFRQPLASFNSPSLRRMVPQQ